MEGLVVVLAPRVAERLERKAERLGMSVEEYIVELFEEGVSPRERTAECIEAAAMLLEQAREELERGDVKQAAGELWGAAALAVKAYASWREGRRLTSHRELWEYEGVATRELEDRVRSVFCEASSIHTYFHENRCTRGDIVDVLWRVGKLLEAIRSHIQRGASLSV